VPCRIDIITKISGGISFLEASSQAEVVQLDEGQMPILSRDHLLINKLATGRPKDLEDVKLLQQHRGESSQGSLEEGRKGDALTIACT